MSKTIKEFVSETLTQISTAVIEANSKNNVIPKERSEITFELAIDDSGKLSCPSSNNFNKVSFKVPFTTYIDDQNKHINNRIDNDD